MFVVWTPYLSLLPATEERLSKHSPDTQGIITGFSQTLYPLVCALRFLLRGKYRMYWRLYVCTLNSNHMIVPVNLVSKLCFD